MDIFCIGDSITQGMWDAKGGWADRIKQHFHVQKLADITAIGHAVFNLGISADTSTDVLKRLPAVFMARHPDNSSPGDIYIVAIGVNDSKQGEVRGSYATALEQYRHNLNSILKLIAPRSRNIIFMGLTPVVEANMHINNPEAIYSNKSIQLFDETLQNFCDEHDLIYIPLFDEMKDQVDEAMSPDGIHPSTAGHAMMFGHILPEVEKLLH